MESCLKTESSKSLNSELLKHLSDRALTHSSDESSQKQEDLYCLRSVWKDHLTSKNQAIFFCRLVSLTIEAYFTKEYSAFDALTSTNCCHGISLLVRKLVLELKEFDLRVLKKLSQEKLELLENLSKISDFCTTWVPKPLIKLSSLYLLALTRTISEGKQKTDINNLRKNIYPISANFCWNIVNNLKKIISNLVAHRYRIFLEEICPLTNINGAPIHLWGAYIQPEHIRRDKKNTDYVSCVFSTQVSLAYLIKTKAKIAIVNDLIRSSGELKDRYVRILEGDGKDKFSVLSEKTDLLNLDPSEPVVIFGGYVYSDTLTIESLSERMNPWLHEFPRLMLACDIFYPQFPGVRDDPNFDNSPIHPEEELLKEVFSSHKQIQGVSISDPSLFCSSHTYLSSLKQLVKIVHDKDLSALPTCFIHPLSE